MKVNGNVSSCRSPGRSVLCALCALCGKCRAPRTGTRPRAIVLTVAGRGGRGTTPVSDVDLVDLRTRCVRPRTHLRPRTLMRRTFAVRLMSDGSGAYGLRWEAGRSCRIRPADSSRQGVLRPKTGEGGDRARFCGDGERITGTADGRGWTQILSNRSDGDMFRFRSLGIGNVSPDRRANGTATANGGSNRR
jgi:hypothetical protein